MITIGKKQETKSEPDWEALFVEWESSGERQAEFCEKRGLKYRDFCLHRLKQLKKERKANGNHFVPVKVKSNGLKSAPISILVLLPNGVQLSIPEKVFQSQVGLILQSLRVKS